MAETTLFDALLKAGEAETERVLAGMNLIGRDDCPPELTQLGTLRWYLHGDLEHPSTRALYFYELEIPAGSKSGRLFCQGGVVHFVVEGSGYSEVDGKMYDWEQEDVIGVPIKEAGITYQHFNPTRKPSRLLVAWPNYDSAIGPQGGVAMRVLEPCPEYAAAHPTDE